MKSCPRCKALLFDDMDTCYGCMYRFNFSKEEKEGEIRDAELAGESSPGLAALTADTSSYKKSALKDSKKTATQAPEIAAVPYGMLMVYDRSSLAGPGSRYQDQCSDSPSLLANDSIKASTRRFPLYEGESVSIGRSRSNTIVLQAANVSRWHARVDVEADLVWLEDLKSANSTRLNGRVIKTRSRLNFGDEFTICGTSFKLIGDDTML